MRIERHYAQKMCLTDFAGKHDLTMVVRERDDLKLPRFFASFKHVDVKDGSVLVGVHGNGETEAEAIADYAAQISRKIITVFGFGGGERTHIVVPALEYLVAKG